MRRIAVVGAGTMGAGIALSAACAGFDVDLVEIDAALRERAGERIKRDAQKLNRSDAPARIQLRSATAEIDEADLAIEAVTEDLALKQRVFVDLESRLHADAILATNTSSLSVIEIAGVLANPGRVIGLHFFNPPTMMKLVEVVRTDAVDDAVIDVGRALVEALGKTPVVVADTPGFIVNRVARPYYLQALRALDRGVGDISDLDALARGIGFRMGPFELMDLIGLDVNLATSESIYERTQAARLAPVARQRKMVAAGDLGRKTGNGFYRYDGNGAASREPFTAPEKPPKNEDDNILVLGFGDLAESVATLLRGTYAKVQHIETDDALDQLDPETTIAFDIGDGVSDRSADIADLEMVISNDAVILVDAYATGMRGLAARLEKPERVVGYGLLGPFERQDVIELVDSDAVDDDALALAEELFAALGKRTMLVGDLPALFLGRVIGSVVNEAVYAVQDGIASADDIDVAMRLGTNYPLGPIAWGREIGGQRVARILSQLAAAEGAEFGPARALWVLDAEAETLEKMAEEQLQTERSTYNSGYA
ncbi:MAG: 3-hydroxybutyryl-CoA dehydrogenase [Candidatus Eremiobacteraeota bacterium]|nr:3-hydroxybutyryl-CoA dehydrogenase [Candidatus Eremiobacteraeota bacterium]